MGTVVLVGNLVVFENSKVAIIAMEEPKAKILTKPTHNAKEEDFKITKDFAVFVLLASIDAISVKELVKALPIAIVEKVTRDHSNVFADHAIAEKTKSSAEAKIVDNAKANVVPAIVNEDLANLVVDFLTHLDANVVTN